MRAYYLTRKHLRGFVFGTPEGWHASVYDRERKEWVWTDRRVYDALKHAKAAVETKLREAVGEASAFKWH